MYGIYSNSSTVKPSESEHPGDQEKFSYFAVVHFLKVFTFGGLLYLYTYNLGSH